MEERDVLANEFILGLLGRVLGLGFGLGFNLFRRLVGSYRGG
jgi:hypothetical protein